MIYPQNIYFIIKLLNKLWLYIRNFKINTAKNFKHFKTQKNELFLSCNIGHVFKTENNLFMKNMSYKKYKKS